MAKRELIDTGTDKRYVRRDQQGQFSGSDDVGRSLRQDVKQKAKTEVKSGQGDRGDQKRDKEKASSTLTPQQRGARTRLAKLSPKRRSEIGRLAALKRWSRIGSIIQPAHKAALVRYWSRELGLE